MEDRETIDKKIDENKEGQIEKDASTKRLLS